MLIVSTHNINNFKLKLKFFVDAKKIKYKSNFTLLK